MHESAALLNRNNISTHHPDNVIVFIKVKLDGQLFDLAYAWIIIELLPMDSEVGGTDEIVNKSELVCQ